MADARHERQAQLERDFPPPSRNESSTFKQWPTVHKALGLIKRELEQQREKSNSMCQYKTAHNWLDYKTSDVNDDLTFTFFWRAHTVTVLFLIVLCLVYVAVFEDSPVDTEYNRIRAFSALLAFWALAGMTIMPDGPFIRPHPALWRLVLALSIAYQMFLIFILFQTKKDARSLFHMLDTGLGNELEQKDYASNCKIYDRAMPDNPWHNVKDKFDIFIFAHTFGYFCKTLMFRDWWLTTVISIMFEFLEYTFEHQLPNFSECWWDHWILDVLICNGLGTVLGLCALHYLRIKTYDWRGLFTIPTYRGKIKRIVSQFSPHHWIEFDWNPTSSLERYLLVCAIVAFFLITELNTFYLKFVLGWPAEHYMNGIRLVLLMFCGAVALRETFQIIDDPACDRIGRQSWMVVGIILTELLICLKFGWETMTKPLPQAIVLWWSFAFVCFCVHIFVTFVLFKPTRLGKPEHEPGVCHILPGGGRYSTDSSPTKEVNLSPSSTFSSLSPMDGDVQLDIRNTVRRRK